MKQLFFPTLLIVIIIAASSLHLSIETLPLGIQKRLDNTFKAVLGLSDDLKANKRLKIFQKLRHISPKN